jgi:hypothetical protein
VSDLTGELLDMAADGAAQARPLNVAEVITAGNRRRARTIGQRSLGGLSALGVGVAIVVSGGVHGPAANPAASGSANVLYLTGTRSSSAGTLTVTVKYRDEPRNKIDVLSLSYSGHIRGAIIKHDTLLIGFGPSLPPLQGSRPGKSGSRSVLLIGVLLPTGRHAFAGSLPSSVLRLTREHGGLSSDEALRVTLTKERPAKGVRTTAGGSGIASVGLLLTR